MGEIIEMVRKAPFKDTIIQLEGKHEWLNLLFKAWSVGVMWLK